MRIRHRLLAAGLAGMLAPMVILAEEAPTTAADKQDEKQVREAATCPAVTGSRIRPRKADGCESAHAVRSYSREELESTGEADLADALRRLDPAVR